MASQSLVQIGKIEQRILLMRGEKVILDSDLAEFYGVSTKRLNEQVKRNIERFPGDFMFQLTADEKSEVVANCDHLNKLKYSKTLPYAFTEHGAIMAAGVINTEKAIEVSIFFVRAFIKLREMINTHQMLKKKIIEIEARLSGHDEQLTQMVQLLKQMLDPKPPATKRRIGF